MDVNTGNVGIGTTSPNRELVVENSVDVDGVAIRVENKGSTWSQFEALAFNAGDRIDTVLFAQAPTGKGGVGTNSNHPFYIRTNNTQRMTIDTSGNVGIGTIVP